MKYKFLSPTMRKTLKKLLDSGEKTPDEIRNNIDDCWFVEHQDEFLPIIELNLQIDRINKEYNTNIQKHLLIVKEIVHSGFFDDKTVKVYANTLEGEMLYFIDKWEIENDGE